MPSQNKNAGAMIVFNYNNDKNNRQPRTLTPKEKTLIISSEINLRKTKSSNKKLWIKGLILIITFLCVPEFQNYVNAVNPSPIGPCTINAGITSFPKIEIPKLPGVNPKLKCTDKGYFELIQCFSDYCVCVDPSTGAEAIITKSSSNKINPICGRCHRSLARYYKNNEDFLFRPLCDVKTGNYAAKQCMDDKHCFCVNVLNGIKLSKEEKPISQIKCDENQFDFSIDNSQITKSEKLASGLTVEQHIPIGNPLCKLPKDSGENRCNSGHGTKGVKWYFDAETFECLAFNYHGCGGNKNRFDSVTECWEQCKLADMAGCAGMRLPATNSIGHTIVCSSMEAASSPIQNCPAGNRCTMLAFMGVCCHSDTQDLYERNYRPICANGKHPVLMEAGGTPANLIGKKCYDNFCPSNSTCIEKEIFAHCCPR